MATLSDEMTAPIVPGDRAGVMRAAVSRWNESIALRMTIGFGSIWCVYAFTVFSLIPLLFPKAQDTLLYVSNCIQLVALPALMVGSALLARSGEKRSAEDHLALVEILADVREELAEVKQIASEVRRHNAVSSLG